MRVWRPAAFYAFLWMIGIGWLSLIPILYLVEKFK